jgi:hypothetical protein
MAQVTSGLKFILLAFFFALGARSFVAGCIISKGWISLLILVPNFVRRIMCFWAIKVN